jgi:hypothetical protein
MTVTLYNEEDSHPSSSQSTTARQILGCSTQDFVNVSKQHMYRDHTLPHHMQSKDERQLLSLKQMFCCQNLRPIMMILWDLPPFQWGWRMLLPLLQVDLWWIGESPHRLRHL